MAVSSNPPEANATVRDVLPASRLLSDTSFENARRYGSYDDFEDTELHSTVLIDKKGRIHWAHTGGAPFDDMAFLEKQLERMNASVTRVETERPPSGSRLVCAFGVSPPGNSLGKE